MRLSLADKNTKSLLPPDAGGKIRLIQQLRTGSKGQANMGSTAGQDGLLGALLGCCCGAAGMGEELYK